MPPSESEPIIARMAQAVGDATPASPPNHQPPSNQQPQEADLTIERLSDDVIAARLAGNPSQAPVQTLAADEETLAIVPARLAESAGAAPPRGWLRRLRQFLSDAIVGGFRFVSLVILLAVIVAIPALQMITLGYMLEVVGRLSRGATLRECLPWSSHATRIGFALLAIFIVSLPVHLLTHWSQVALLVDPASNAAFPLRVSGFLAAAAAAIYLAWAWTRGGRLRDYFWPAPLRFLKEFWRPATWVKARNQFWDLVISLEIPRLFWLGLRGFVATLAWIILPALLLIGATREGEGGGAGILGAVAFLVMGLVLVYLPVLQSHFAAENRFAAMFEVRAARRAFQRAPWAITWSLLLVYGLAIPLYLLKIETLPQEATWLPCLMFVALMLPARIAAGLAMRRARRLELRRGFWRGVGRWSARLCIPAIVGSYLLAVFLSQYLDVHGLQTWIHQHAVLVPVPFTGT